MQEGPSSLGSTVMCDMVTTGCMEALTFTHWTRLNVTAQGERREGPSGQETTSPWGLLALETLLPVVQFQRNSFQATNLTVRLQVGEFIQLDFTVSVQRSSTIGVILNSPLHFCRTVFIFHGFHRAETPGRWNNCPTEQPLWLNLGSPSTVLPFRDVSSAWF